MALPVAHVATTDPARRAGPAVVAVGLVVAACCLGFAVVNVAFEATDRFADGRYAEYAAGLTVMNWVVVGLKLVGAALALLAVVDRPRLLPPRVLTTLVWAAFGTLAPYAASGVVQAVLMAAGLMGGPEQIDLAGIAYVAFFVALATGYGVLAVSTRRRYAVPARFAVIGFLAGPLVPVLLLVVTPMALTAAGIMPAT